MFPLALKFKKFQDHLVYRKMHNDIESERGIEEKRSFPHQHIFKIAPRSGM